MYYIYVSNHIMCFSLSGPSYEFVEGIFPSIHLDYSDSQQKLVSHLDTLICVLCSL